MSVPTGSTPVSRRQKRMGPAPFASFEDLSDELESPEDKNAAGSVVRLPGIREDATPSTPQPLEQPEFVYTGISLVGAVTLSPNSMSCGARRAASPTSRLQPGAPRIDISRASSSSHHDSRDSTPERELFEAHDPATAKLGLGFREEGALDLRSSTEELDYQDEQVKRKGQSGLSRSPSPHKMLLETSFCGTKPPEKASQSSATGTKADDIERVLLARPHDPTQAVLAEGTQMPPKKPARKMPKADITIKVDEPPAAISTTHATSANIPKTIVGKSGVEYIYIPLKGPLPADPEPAHKVVRESKSAGAQSKTPRPGPGKPKPKSASATPSPVSTKKSDEPKYIRIKLKPDYMYSQEDAMTKPDTLELNHDAITTLPPKDEPGKSLTSTPSASPKLPRQTFLKETAGGSKTPSPSLSRKSSFASLFRSKETIVSPESPTVPGGCRRKNTLTGMLREAGERSRSRSKSRDRSAAPSSTESIDSSKSTKSKSVFSIFKPKRGEPKAKHDHDGSAADALPSIEGIAKVEFKFNEASGKKKYYETPLEGESIRIPLHSPTHYDENHTILQDIKTSSQDSQDTVIEVCRNVEAVVEKVPQQEEIRETSNNHVQAPPVVNSSSNEFNSKRQSSTSSENVVFSTKLGSNNEIFSTKLPKKTSQTNGHEEQAEITIEHIPATTTTTTTTITTSATISNRHSTVSVEDERERYSSESERDSEVDFPAKAAAKNLDLKLDLDLLEPERKTLVLQDSYEDELPYVPTTLPLERSAAVPIVPIKQRSTFEMKTCPIERPRSTTPINPSCLEDYCEEVMGGINVENVTKTIEKLKISLPRHDSVDKPIKSPRKPISNTTNWFQFAEKGISARRSSLTQEETTPPPLPPKGVQKEWINFEEIPERRKPPKRIQTLPSRGHIDVPDAVLQDNVVYNYVNPEECKCECHELTARKEKMPDPVQEDELPLLEDEPVDDEKIERIKLDVAVADRRSIVSDSSVDLSTSVEPPEPNGGLELSLRTPFTSDLGVSSNRSSSVSQEEPQSPDSGSPNAFPKTF